MPTTLDRVLDSDDPAVFELQTNSPGPKGTLPLTEQMLESPSGDLWNVAECRNGVGSEPAFAEAVFG